MRSYWVYILASMPRGTLYIGVTSDLGQRLREHREQQEGSFSAQYHTAELLYFEVFDGIEIAIEREKQFKGWKRAKKDALVVKANPRWEDLSWQFEREQPRTEDLVLPENCE